MDRMTLSNLIPVDALLIALIVLVALVGIALVRLELKLRRLCRGAQGADLEKAINALGDDLEALQKFEEESKGYFKNVEKRIRRCSQAVEVVRFNAFKGDGLGGNQSFAAAILSEEGDGAVISSLYSRDRVSVFAKPIAKFKSELSLSEEEAQAIAGAKAKLSAK